MTDTQRQDIEGFLLVGFLSMQEIATRVGVTKDEVIAVMMAMEVPSTE